MQALLSLLFLPQNLYTAAYHGYNAPSGTSFAMRIVISLLPFRFNKNMVKLAGEDALMRGAMEKSKEYPTPATPPTGVRISQTNDFDDLATGCDGKWQFYIIEPTSDLQTPKSGTTPQSSSFFLYLHGGAYVATAQPAHFEFLYDISRRTGATILLPIYPRPPLAKVTYKEVLDVLVNLVQRLRGEDSSNSSGSEIVKKARKTARFTIGGDSAGGGMSIALCLLLMEKELNNLLPNLLYLNAPWIDVSMAHPEMGHYDKLDPWLPLPFLSLCGKLWAGGKSNTQNKYASPAFATDDDLLALREAKTHIAIFQGEADLTCPDTLVLVERLKELKIPFDFVYKSGVPHVYPLFPNTVPESAEARRMIASLIQNA